jgi:predicted PurR-regulated permease PerM
VKSTFDFNQSLDTLIRLALVIVLVAWCGMILYPFLSPVLWGGIIAVATAPLYHKITRLIGNRGRLSAIVVTVILLAVIFVPGFFFVRSMVHGIESLSQSLSNGTLTMPAPDARVGQWPVVGEQLYSFWVRASENLQGLIMEYSDQLTSVGEWMLNALFSTGLGLLQLILAILASGFFLLYSDKADKVILDFARRIMGERGEEFADMAERTVRNVTKGILGVAVIQAAMLAIGFILAGVPYAGIWAVLCLVLSVIQIGPGIIVIAIIVWLFTEYSLLYAGLWSIYLGIAMFADNILKPFILGKGAPVPMPVVFLGALGGFFLSGFIGLFTGAVVLSLGYRLLLSWLYPNSGSTGEVSG